MAEPSNVILPEASPSKAIVLAVASFVAVAALPEVFWLPPVLTPGRFIFAEPLNDTPPIVLAVCSTVAVAAFPVMSDVIEFGNLASEIVPDEIFEALILVILAPLPNNVALILGTVNLPVDGLYVKCESSVSI